LILGLVALGLGLLQARYGAIALRVQRLDLPLRQFERRLRTVECGVILMQLRGVLLGVLNRARDCVREVLVARRLLLREHQRRLRLVHLRLVGADLRLLHIELRIDISDIGSRGGHLRFGLGECRAVSAVIDAGDHLACGDVLIVGDRDGRDVARHLRCDRELTRRDIGIVGRLEMAGVVPVDVSGWQRQH
jgi:hypothetical protein